MQNNLKMRAFYEGQIREHKRQKQNQLDTEVQDRKDLNKTLA